MKAFINDAAPHFKDLEVKYVGGAIPEISFISEDGDLIEKVNISSMKKAEIVELMASFGLLFSHDSEMEFTYGEL